MATEIGALVVRIGADAEDLLKDLKRLDSGFGSMGKNIKLAHDGVAAFASAALAAGTAVAAMVTIAAKGAEQMYKLAQSTGLTTEAFSQLAYAAELSGINADALSQALGRLNRNVSDAASGTGDARRAFNALHIYVKTAEGTLKGADEIMAEVSDKFAGMKDGAEKAALAVAIFGKSGAQLIPMLNEGAQKLSDLREEAIQLGVSIDTKTGKAAEAFNDNLTRLQMSSKGLANALMMELLPEMNAVTDALVANAKEGGYLKNNIQLIADVIRNTALPVFQVLAIIGSDLNFIFRAIGGEFGVWAAQLAALARLDFKGFKLISQEWTADAAKMRADLDEFQARILALSETKLQPKAEAPESPKAAGPRIGSTGEDMTEAQRVQDEVDEVARIRQEADAAVVAMRDKEIADQKAFEDQKLSVILAAIDAEAEARDSAAREQHEQDEKNHADSYAFQRASYQQQGEMIVGQLVNLSAGVSRHNRKMFELNKAAGTAQAIISAYVGISKTLETYPYPLSVAMAALQAYAAFAQVQAIQSTSFDTKSGTPSLAGGTPATPVTPVGSTAVADRGQTTVVNIHGEVFGRKQLRDLVRQINEGNRDGNQIVLGGAA